MLSVWLPPVHCIPPGLLCHCLGLLVPVPYSCSIMQHCAALCCQRPHVTQRTSPGFRQGRQGRNALSEVWHRTLNPNPKPYFFHFLAASGVEAAAADLGLHEATHQLPSRVVQLPLSCTSRQGLIARPMTAVRALQRLAAVAAPRPAPAPRHGPRPPGRPRPTAAAAPASVGRVQQQG